MPARKPPLVKLKKPSTTKARARASWRQLTVSQRETHLRQAATPAERTLLRFLMADPRTRDIFRHQSHLLGYYPDFSFPSRKLIVELDGSTHCGTRARLADARRTRKFTKAGWRVIRFWNSSLRNPMEVLEQICAALNQPATILI